MEGNEDPSERKVSVRLSNVNVELTDVSSPVSPDSSASLTSPTSPASPSPDLNEPDLRSPSSPDSNRQAVSSLKSFSLTHPHAAEFLRHMRWQPSDLTDSIDPQILDQMARVERSTCPPRYETNRRLGNLLYGIVLGRNGISYTDAEKPETNCCCSPVDCSSRVLVRGRSLLLKSTSARQKAIVINELREGLIDGIDFLSKACFGSAYLAQLILAHAPNPFNVISQSTATIGIAKLFTEYPALFVFPASVGAAVIAKILINVCRVEDPTMNTINTHEARLQTISQGCWEDYTRQLFPFSTLKRALGNLRHQILWAGELPIEAREKGFHILVKLAQNQRGYSQNLAMSTLAEVVSGIHLDDYEKLREGYNKDVLIHISSIKTRALKALQTLREDLHQRKGCNFTLINAIYSDYLLWRHGYSPSTRSAIGISVLVLAFLTHTITSRITLFKAIYEYVRCPQKPGFTFAGGYAPWSSTFSKKCFDELVKRFGIFPGQPAHTLTDTISDYHLGTSYDLDLSNKGLDGNTVNAILEGFRANGISIRSLNLEGNFVNKARDFRALASTAPDLEILNLSHNGIEDFYAGSGPDDSAALGESLGNWTALQELDLSDNPIESQDFTGTRAFANALRRLLRLRSFKIPRAKLGYLGSEGLQTFANGTQATSLTHLDVSGNPLENVDSVGSTDLMEKLPPSITSLDVSDCNLGAQDTASFTALANNFWRLPFLARLRISGNHIILAGDKGFLSFVQNLRFLRNLGELGVHPQFPSLNSTQVADFNQEQRYTRVQRNLTTPLHTPEDVDAYLGSLPNTTTTFNLSALIGNQGIVRHLMNRLANFRVVVLDMSNNWLEFFNDDGSVDFGNGLQNFTSLTEVRFSNNFIGKWGSRGEKAIGNGLKPLPSVEVVDGSHNLIGYTGSDGEVALAEGLQPSTRRIDFSDNWLGGTSTQGPIALGRRMAALLNLDDVNLSYTYLAVWGPDGVVLIANNLNSRVLSLNLERTTIGSTSTNDTVALSNNLSRFRNIRKVKLAFNNIGSNGEQGISQLLETLPQLTNFQEGTFAGFPNDTWTEGAQVQEALYGKGLRQTCEAELCFGTPLHSEDTSDQTQQPQESSMQLTSTSSSDTREASQQTQTRSPSPKSILKNPLSPKKKSFSSKTVHFSSETSRRSEPLTRKARAQLSEESASVVDTPKPLPVQQLLAAPSPSSALVDPIQSITTSPRLEFSESRPSIESTQSQEFQPSTSISRAETSTSPQASNTLLRLELPESRSSSESTQSQESQPRIPTSTESLTNTNRQSSRASASSSQTVRSVQLPSLVQTSSASPKAQPMGTGFWKDLKSWFSFDAWVDWAQQAASNLMVERDPDTGRLVNTMPATFPNALNKGINDWAQPTDRIGHLSLNASALQSAPSLLSGPQILDIGRP